VIATLRFVNPEFMYLVRTQITQTRDEEMGKTDPLSRLEVKDLRFKFGTSHSAPPSS